MDVSSLMLPAASSDLMVNGLGPLPSPPVYDQLTMPAWYVTPSSELLT